MVAEDDNQGRVGRATAILGQTQARDRAQDRARSMLLSSTNPAPQHKQKPTKQKTMGTYVGVGTGRFYLGTMLVNYKLPTTTFALPKKGPQNLPDPLTRDWYHPGNFCFRSSCEGLVTRLDNSNNNTNGTVAKSRMSYYLPEVRESGK